jgi:hypothetical protein
VFSYSVVQHFEKAGASLAFSAAGRVLNEGRFGMIQMANMFGVRSLYYQMRRGFRSARDFEVRYWLPGEMKAAVNRSIGPAEPSVDGYFSLNPQPSEAHLLPWRFRWVVRISEFMRVVSSHLALLKCLADSVYVVAFKAATGHSKDVRARGSAVEQAGYTRHQYLPRFTSVFLAVYWICLIFGGAFIGASSKIPGYYGGYCIHHMCPLKPLP